MNHLNLNLLPWRTRSANKKIMRDVCCIIFFIGVGTLCIECTVWLMKAYSTHRIQQIAHLCNKKIIS